MLLFVIFTLMLTYPLVFKMNSAVPGFFYTDEPYGVLWNFWRIDYSWKNNLSLKFTDLVAYPFGIDFSHKFPKVYFWDMMTFLLGIIMKSALAYNIQVLLNFVLSGFFMYLLVYFLARDSVTAMFSGIIFTFCPQHFVRSWQHIGLTYLQWMPLYLLTIFKLKEKPNLRNCALTTAALLIVASFDSHYFYFMLIAALVFLLYELFYWLRIKNKTSIDFIKYLILAVISTIIMTLPQYWLYIRNIFNKIILQSSSRNPFLRPFEDLFSQSAKPLSYLLPSTEHPIFGNFTKYFVGDFLYGQSFTEHTLYLGWTTIILAFVAFRFWKRKRKIQTTTDLQEKENFAIGYFILLTIVAWFFSQPPWWKFGSVRIFMPSFFTYKILPMVRAYARFGILVLLALSVLAGFGLKFILDRIKSNFKKMITAICFCGLILFEFFNIPSEHIIDLSKTPSVYQWLKEQKEDFVIAEYPLDIEGQEVSYLFYQTKHHKKMINGTIPGTKANEISRTITKLSEPKTAGVLKWLGVKYVLVHTDAYKESDLTSVKEELKAIKRNRKLRFINNFDDVDVYEVIAKPIEPDVILQEGELQ
jgi:hypothetical protein